MDMKHPALARVMAVTLAIMCVIMLIIGALGFGKAEKRLDGDDADYERLTERIATYKELTAKLADAESYKQASAALDEHQQQHNEDAAQYRTDLAERTAKQGGYKKGADALWEAKPAVDAGAKAYYEAESKFKAAEAEYNTKMAEMSAQRGQLATLQGVCASAPALPTAPTEPTAPTPPNEDSSDEEKAAYETAVEQYKSDMAAYNGLYAQYQADLAVYNTALQQITAERKQIMAGVGGALSQMGIPADSPEAASAALGGLIAQIDQGMAAAGEQMNKAREQLASAKSAVESAQMKVNGNLEQIWYELGKMEDEEPELEQKREELLNEAVELAEEKAAAEERREDERKLGATRRTLKGYDGIKAKLTDDAELGEVAAQYADEYRAEYTRAHTARVAISVLEVLGGVLGLCCLPAAFEKSRSRLVLIAPAAAALACAAAAEITAAMLALGQCYAALPVLIFAPLYLLAAIPKNKPPVQTQE